MSMDPVGAAAEPGIRAARTVTSQISELDQDVAGAVRRAILSIGHAEGEPISIPTPGPPRDMQYLSLVPDHLAAPVIIYRQARPGEKGKWLVTALISREAYQHQREAERAGILDDQFVRLVAGTEASKAVSVTQARTENQLAMLDDRLEHLAMIMETEAEVGRAASAAQTTAASQLAMLDDRLDHLARIIQTGVGTAERANAAVEALAVVMTRLADDRAAARVEQATPPKVDSDDSAEAARINELIGTSARHHPDELRSRRGQLSHTLEAGTVSTGRIMPHARGSLFALVTALAGFGALAAIAAADTPTIWATVVLAAVIVGFALSQTVVVLGERRQAMRERRERHAEATRQACAALIRAALELRTQVANAADYHGNEMGSLVAEIRRTAADLQVQAVNLALIGPSALKKTAEQLAGAGNRLATSTSQRADLNLGSMIASPDFSELDQMITAVEDAVYHYPEP
jgi:hypothetical protein